MSEYYSELVMDHFTNPRNAGVIDDADGVGVEYNPVCGDLMKLMLRIKDEVITEAKFQTEGCVAAIATSSVATEMIIGKNLPDVEKLTREDFASALGGLPPAKLHCSVLAAGALHKALADYRSRHSNKRQIARSPLKPL